MANPYLRMTDVKLSFPVMDRPQSKYRGTVAKLGGAIKHIGNKVEVTALNHISLEICEGERVGVIGPNGSGKTTLLKTIAGIFKPQEGIIRRRGRLVSIINPWVGLENDLTGIENIWSVAMLMGINREEVAAHLDEVVEFCELGEFIDMPLNTYSQGMKTRLAFSISTAFDPEILVVDENISAGDARFSENAGKRMENIMLNSNIIVLASHTMETIRKFCDRAVFLDRGEKLADGPVDEVIETYHQHARQ